MRDEAARTARVNSLRHQTLEAARKAVLEKLNFGDFAAEVLAAVREEIRIEGSRGLSPAQASVEAWQFTDTIQSAVEETIREARKSLEWMV